jgi:histidinol-phosphatase
MTDLSAELQGAIEIAQIGGAIALEHFGNDPESHRKPDGSWVTEADVAAERAIRAAIRERFPDHNVLGEEGGSEAADGGPFVHGAPTWIVDPIDGTNNYMSGISVWATLVALQIEERNVVGVCCAPALGEMYDAARGMGARLNAERIRVDPVDDLSEAALVTEGGSGFVRSGYQNLYRSLTERCHRTRGFGDFWGHMLVARGSAHVMLDSNALKVWDVAALIPIVTEAGGRFTHFDGSEWTGEGDCLCTNGILHDEVVRLAASSPD